VSARRPQVLDELGLQFSGLGPPSRAPRRWTRGTVLVALALVLALAGATAAAIVIARGGSLPGANPRDLAANGVPLPGSERLAGLDAPDPDAGEPSWDLRLSRTAAGETCTAVGQVLGGQFGIVGLDHVFRALPLGGVDACGVSSPGAPLLAGVRVFVGRTPSQVRTVVDGIAGAGTRSVIVDGPGGPRRLPLGPDGSFITVYAGYVEEVRPRVLIADASGRQRVLAFAQTTVREVPDPEGRSPWEVSGGPDLEAGAYPDENCVQASEELGRSDPSRFEAPLTPEVCGRLGSQPLFVLMRRFVPGSGEHTGFPWNNTPARTLVYGAADPRVVSLTLKGPAGGHPLHVERRGGAFLAVLDGHVDPRSLTLVALTRDGRRHAYTHSTALFSSQRNRPWHEAPVPAFRRPRPASTLIPPMEFPIASSVRETLRAADPAGGPEWVLRSWRGRPDPRANFGSPPSEFVCDQLGVLQGGRLVQPPPAAPVALVAGRESEAGEGGCNEVRWLAKHPPVGEMVSFVSDPYAYSPVPLRTVVMGMVGRRARNPQLLGAGAPRALPVDRNGIFLAVLPGRFWDAHLRIVATVAGKRVNGFPLQGFNGPAALETPQARAPDPNGGPPWGFTVSGLGFAQGQIMDGRLVALDPRSGTVHAGPDGWGGGPPARVMRTNRPPVQFEARGDSGSPIAAEPGQYSPPEVERRTLPGRTIITGRADADVAAVTIVTPRDVRTLRPTGPGRVLIAVYDGQFFSGSITATVLLRNGRRVPEQIRDFTNLQAEAPPEPSLAVRLQRTRRELRGWRGPRRGPGRVAEGYLLLAGSLKAIEGRIAFIHLHPGVLPEG